MARRVPGHGDCWNLSAFSSCTLTSVALTPSVILRIRGIAPLLYLRTHEHRNCILTNDFCSLLPLCFTHCEDGLILSLISSAATGHPRNDKPLLYLERPVCHFAATHWDHSFITTNLFFMATYHRDFLMNNWVPSPILDIAQVLAEAMQPLAL